MAAPQPYVLPGLNQFLNAPLGRCDLAQLYFLMGQGRYYIAECAMQGDPVPGWLQARGEAIQAMITAKKAAGMTLA